jgi:exonuclease SbcC
MRIDKVELKNIGPHKQLSVNFAQGLIGLIGSNGAGKSTLVNSIYAALTNDFSRFGNAKADIITNGTTDHSYIKINGRHAGQLFELTRWLRPNKSEFTLGTVNYSKATDVNEAIINQLNIPKIIVDKYVFVNQWEMFSFIDQSAVERAKTFQYLCGTEAVSQAYKVCNDFATRQETVQVIDNSLELTETLADQEKLLEAYKLEIQNAKAAMLSPEQKQEQQTVIHNMEFANTAEISLDLWKIKFTQVKNQVAENDKQLVEIETRIKKRVDWQTNNKSKINTAQKLLDAYTEYERQAGLKNAALVAKRRAEAGLQNLEPVIKDESKYCPKSKRDKLIETIGELRLLVKQAQSLELNQENCPHCGQILAEEYRDKVLAELKVNREKLAPLEQILDYSKKFDEKSELYKKKEEGFQKILDDANKLIESLDSALVPFGSGDKEEAERILSKNKQAQNQINDLTKEHSSCQAKINKFEGEIETIKGLIAKYQTDARNKPSKLSYDAAVEALQTHEEAKLAKQRAVGAYKASKDLYDKTVEMLHTLKARLAKQVKIQNLTSVVREVSEIFHWSNLPKTVAQANLELLITDINANLALFNHPFQVEADVDLTLKVILPGQEPVKAKQLSGGQKVILAVAFRSALDRVFGCDTGMLFLDEPTAGLDADNLNYFHNALQALAQKVGDKQLVVITHVHEFKETFDQVIEITRS